MGSDEFLAVVILFGQMGDAEFVGMELFVLRDVALGQGVNDGVSIHHLGNAVSALAEAILAGFEAESMVGAEGGILIDCGGAGQRNRRQNEDRVESHESYVFRLAQRLSSWVPVI